MIILKRIFSLFKKEDRELEEAYQYARSLLPVIAATPDDLALLSIMVGYARNIPDGETISPDFLRLRANAVYEGFIAPLLDSGEAADVNNPKYDAAYAVYSLLNLCADKMEDADNE